MLETSLASGGVTIQRKHRGRSRLASLASEAAVMPALTLGPNGLKGRKTTQAEMREIISRGRRSPQTEGRRCRAIAGRPIAKRGGRRAVPGLLRRAGAPVCRPRPSAPRAIIMGGISRPTRYS